MSKFRLGHSNGEKESSGGGRMKLADSVEENLNQLHQKLGPDKDLVIRKFLLKTSETTVAAIFMDGITDKLMVNEIVRALINVEECQQEASNLDSPLVDQIQMNMLGVSEVHMINDLDDAILGILSGDTILLLDGSNKALGCNTQGGEARPVSEPSSQVVIRGPRDGFIESIGTNVALVRRRIRNPNLCLEKMKIGSLTQTDVAVMYLKGIASKELIEEVNQRLKGIHFDSILESGYIENLIQDKTITPFPSMYNTERPDTVAANILEGRVAIFVDGTPFVLIAPSTFFMFFQAAEDYYQRIDVSIAIRLLRYITLLISLFGPSVYIAAITFHPEMIPTALLISLAAQRESVPFPALIEALIMEVTFEILREAGVRMPRAIGQAVSIVGALVLGQAAVQAGIVSSTMVIVVALTGISSFSTPSFSMALSIRLLRFIIMIIAAFMGFFGIVTFTVFLIAHMCSIESFGTFYMSPLAPFSKQKNFAARHKLMDMGDIKPKEIK